jgi:hypothetical protein
MPNPMEVWRMKSGETCLIVESLGTANKLLYWNGQSKSLIVCPIGDQLDHKLERTPNQWLHGTIMQKD